MRAEMISCARHIHIGLDSRSIFCSIVLCKLATKTYCQNQATATYIDSKSNRMF